jgi:hypothetical protein
MTLEPIANSAKIAAAFEAWLHGVGDAIQVDGRGPLVLSPPAWFA